MVVLEPRLTTHFYVSYYVCICSLLAALPIDAAPLLAAVSSQLWILGNVSFVTLVCARRGL